MSTQSFTTEDGSVSELDLVQNTVTTRDLSGTVRKMDLGQADVHIDSALANYASGFKLQNGMADTTMPPVLVDKASNYYFEWNKDDAFQGVDGLETAPGANVKEVSPRLGKSQYSCKNYALGCFVATEVESHADSPLTPSMNAMRRVMNAILLAREVRVAAVQAAAGSYDFNTTLGATFKWNGGASSDPIADIHNICELSLQPVTHMLMSEKTYHAFVRNPNVQKYTAYKTTVPGLPTADGVNQGMALLGLPNILISGMKFKDPVTSNYGYVLGNNVSLLCLPSSGFPVDGQEISSGYTFRWNVSAAPDQTTVDSGFSVRSYFDPRRGARGGRVVVVTHSDAEQVTSKSIGGLIVGAWQLNC